MNSRQLECFRAIVEHGSVTRAAAALRIAQPSLSQTLRTMERELGIELFHRIGHRLVLSPAGEALIGPARLVLRDLREAQQSVRDVRGLAAGRLDIATLATLAVDPVAGFVGEFRKRYPGITFRLTAPEDATAVGELVRTGECELGFAHVPLVDSDLIVRQLAVQRLVVVQAPHTAAAPTKALTLRALADMAWVATPIGTSTRSLLEEALASLGAAAHIVVETHHREAIMPLVLAGAGATLLPEPLAEEAKQRGAVVRPTTPAIERRIAIVHRADRLSPTAAAFLAANQETAAHAGR
ncbi:MAG: LysR family transcriptional regulator [Sciscionella sp.]